MYFGSIVFETPLPNVLIAIKSLKMKLNLNQAFLCQMPNLRKKTLFIRHSGFQFIEQALTGHKVGTRRNATLSQSHIQK